MTITREALTQAAAIGQALSHLNAGQVWAAHKLCVPPERLQKPLASHIAALLDNVERKARREFFGGVTPNDTDEILSRTYGQQPTFFASANLGSLEGRSEHVLS